MCWQSELRWQLRTEGERLDGGGCGCSSAVSSMLERDLMGVEGWGKESGCGERTTASACKPRALSALGHDGARRGTPKPRLVTFPFGTAPLHHEICPEESHPPRVWTRVMHFARDHAGREVAWSSQVTGNHMHHIWGSPCPAPPVAPVWLLSVAGH
jgi:hypothetical protein